MVDGVEKISHKGAVDFDNLDQFSEEDCQRYDLEECMVPAVVRKVLKNTKLREVMQVRCSREDKLVSTFDDDVFRNEWFRAFKHDVVITFALLEFQYKEPLFKMTMAEKIEKISALKNLASKFYKVR